MSCRESDARSGIALAGHVPQDPLRVLLITRDFPPISHSGTLRNEAFARFLPDFGIEPAIFTRCPDGVSESRGIDLTTLAEWQDDPKWPDVTRVRWSPSKSDSRWPQVCERLPGLSILRSQAERKRTVTHLLPTARQAAQANNVAAILASFSPSENLLLGVRLGRELGLPVVADLRDPWSYQPIPPYRHYVDFLLERKLERRTLAECAAVIVNTRTARELIESKLGVPSERVYLIRNGFNESDFEDSSISPEPLDPGKFVMLHAGQLARGNSVPLRLTDRFKTWTGFDYDPINCDYAARSPRYVIQAMEQLLTAHPELVDQLRLWFVGMNDRAECEAVRQFRYPQCLKIIPRVDTKSAANLTSRADLLLLLQYRYILDGRDSCLAIPAKLYAYLRSGRRILACVQPSEIADLVDQYKVGTVVDPLDSAEIGEGILAEFQRWKGLPGATSGVATDYSEFERHALTGQLADVIRGCVSQVSESKLSLRISGDR